MRSEPEPELDQLRTRIEELERDLAQARAGANLWLAQILSEVRDPICGFDRGFRFVYVNLAYERFAGLPRLALLGKTPEEANLPPPVANTWMETLRRVIESGEETQLEFMADDGVHLFESRFSPQRPEPADDVAQVIVITRDVTARKQTEREMERARNQVDSILDGMSESFLELDREWRFTYVSRQVLEQTRKRRQELIGHSIWELFPFLRESAFGTEFERVMRDRAPTRFEVRFEASGRWFVVHAHPAADGMTAYVNDISDWKRSDQALRDAHDTLQALVHASPLPIIAFAPDGNVTVWNEAAERTFGWNAEEAIGRPLPFIPPEKLEEHRELRAQGLAGAGFTGLELRRRRKDGAPIDISVSTAPIRNPDGSVRAVVNVCEDITARKHIERALRESEATLRMATDSAGVGIWSYDVVHDRLKLSALAASLIGLPGSEVEIGVRQFLEHVHDADRPRVKHTIRETLEKGTEYSDEYRVVPAQGETRWVFARGLAATDAAGNKIRFSGVINDTTQRKKVEQELARHAQDLARSNADLQQFAFVTSHDLQEPLRTITAYAQLLSRHCQGSLDADGQEFLTFIVDGATRMQHLINDLLAFSRILHEHERMPAEVDMEAVFAWVVMNLNRAIKESGARITHDPLPPVLANQQEMVQLVQNLASNAIKYRGPDPPLIHVGVEEAAGEVRFSVRDNGIGIDPSYHEQIFGVFKRLHGKEVPGTGIGLALSKRIVEKHGGRIWVESEAGKGATFCFTLPR
jgi:PAS domain S-box-containing protein